MLVEIHSNDSGCGMISTLSVYKCYNTQQKLFENRRYCTIEEDDFLDLLSESEQKKFESGKYQFNVPLNKLEEKAIKLHR